MLFTNMKTQPAISGVYAYEAEHTFRVHRHQRDPGPRPWQLLARAWLKGPQVAGYEPADIPALCAQGLMQLWTVDDAEAGTVAAAVTQIVQYPRRKVLEIVAIGGDGSARWGEELHRALVAFAREHGCSHVRAYTRPGGARRLKRRYRFSAVADVVELEV